MKKIINKTILSLLNIWVFEATKFSANFLIIIPKTTGTVTTKNIFSAIPVIEMFWETSVIPNKSADVKIIKGTVIILNKLITAVKDIDNATSPSANFVITLDVTPPGAAAMIITPIAISGGVFKIKINMYATIGRIINWEIKPTIKSFGVLNTLPKSSSFNPRPKPSMIRANMIGAILVTISNDFPLLKKKLYNIFNLITKINFKPRSEFCNKIVTIFNKTSELSEQYNFRERK